MKYTEKMLKRVYPEYISEKRRPIHAPNRIVEGGNAVFGTFDSEITELNIRDAKNAIKWTSKALNRFRVKEWQAFQVDFPEGFLVGAIYGFGYAMANVIIYFDKTNNEIFSVKKFSLVKKNAVVSTLTHGKIENFAGGLGITITNDLADGKCKINIVYEKQKKKIFSANLSMNSIAMPSVCVMPLGKNRPLYSEKVFFSAEGKLVLNGKDYAVVGGRGIIDDHKGYYPRKMHYDWVTGIGKEDGTDIAFNLTDNQVINKTDYNENYIWLGGELHPLPPVHFAHTNKDIWKIKDEFGAVNLNFKINKNFKIYFKVGLVKMDYTAPFGTFSGHLTDIDGKKHILNGVFGMGEDKNIFI